MKASSAYRTQIIKEALAKEYTSTANKLAEVFAGKEAPRHAHNYPRLQAEVTPLLERLNEIHTMLTEKPE